MKIPFTNIHIGRAINKTTPPDVLTKIVQTQLTRSRSQIKDWINATSSAESIYFPNRVELMRIYQNIVIDGHLSALVNVLRLRIADSPLQFVTPGNNIDEKAAKLFSTTWFRRILEMYVDAQFYGYSLAQIVEINGIDVKIEDIPREYVVPEKRLIKLSQYGTADGGINIDDKKYNPALIYCDSGTLGLYHKAAPLVITKRAVVGAWSEYCEIFGMPIRVGRTNINVPANYNNMQTMLANMGSAAYAVLDESDKLEFIETTKTDAFQVFDQFINRQNSELSKLFLGQTGTTDEKAFTGSANVHSDILDAIVGAYVQKMCNWLNSDVLPKLARYNVLTAGLVAEPAGGIRLTVEQKIQAVEKLSNNFNIDPDWIADEIGVPVTPKTAAVPGPPVNRGDLDIRDVINKIYFGNNCPTC